MIRVLIADDHPIVRSGLEKVLSKEPEIVVVGEAANGREVLEFVRSKECDVIILDITMPDKRGLEILEQLKRERRKAEVLILSMHKEDVYALKAYRAGASGYLTKESAATELIRAVKKIASGGKYVSLHFAEKMASSIDRTRDGEAPHERLSSREFEMMLMIASGLTPRAIADKACLSVRTVNSYRMRILEKMGMKTNAELVRYALENKLLE
jgi:two-component system, NarL family, invasion response regulator UvrY